MGTAIKHPVPDQVKPSFAIFDIWALCHSALSVTVPGCQKFKWRLNAIWHRMLYSCTHMTTVGISCWKCQLVAVQLDGCSTASDLQLQNTCLHSCCRFVSQRTSLMWQNAADDDLRRRISQSFGNITHTISLRLFQLTFYPLVGGGWLESQWRYHISNSGEVGRQVHCTLSIDFSTSYTTAYSGLQSPNVYRIVWRFNNITDCLAYMTTLYCEQFSRDTGSTVIDWLSMV